MIYAAVNCQFPEASSACSLIGEGMIYASTRIEPGMMDGMAIKQLCSVRVKETSLAWPESLAPRFVIPTEARAHTHCI